MTTPDRSDWLQVAARAAAAAAEHFDLAKTSQILVGCYPQPDETVLVRGPDDELVLVSDVADDRLKWLKQALHERFTDRFLGVLPSRLWEDPEGEYIKIAYSPTIRTVGETMNLLPGKLFGAIPNSPGPVSSMLTSGLLGAGLGYGAGWLGEKMMPDDWRRGRLRNTLALLGGTAGMAPGLAYGLSNVGKGVPFNDNSTLNHHPVGGVLPESHFPIAPLFKSAVAKFAAELSEYTGMSTGLPPIQVDKFNQTIWGDPYVSPGIPLPTAGAATAAVSLAQQMPGGIGPGWVTPMQMGHLAAGAGVGYLSGAIVGGMLGVLTGLPDETQNQLKRTGAYAGIVGQVIPMLFNQQ